MCLWKKKPDKLTQECWNIDYSFILWLHEHLTKYLEDASKVVDLEYHKIDYKGNTYTQLEIINKILEITTKLKDEDAYYGIEDVGKQVNEMLDLFKTAYFYLWW